VVAVNVCRAVLVTRLWTSDRFAFSPWGYELVGLGIFLATVLLIVSTDQLFECLAPYRSRGPDVFEMRDAPRRMRADANRTVWPAWEQTPVVSPATVACGAGLLLLQLAFLVAGGLRP
jgi:hypothetical protein